MFKRLAPIPTDNESIPEACDGTFQNAEFAVYRLFGTLKTCHHKLLEQTLISAIMSLANSESSICLPVCRRW